MPADPSRGGQSLIFLANSGSCFSAARNRLMPLTVQEIFLASIARTFPDGPQLSFSGVPASLYRALTYWRATTVRALFMITSSEGFRTPLLNAHRRLCKVYCSRGWALVADH